MELDERLLQKVAAYKPSPAALEPIRHTPILFVVGISGAGKDAVQHALINKYPDQYQHIVSHTTRAPRTNHGVMEQNGVDYHFVTFTNVGRLIDEAAFVETKVYAGNIYGTSVASVLAVESVHKIAITDIEIRGVEEYVKLGMNVKPVFLLPPSYEVWQQRLLARYGGKVDQHDYYKRMQTALVEIEHAIETDYFYIVINDDLDHTVKLVNEIAHGEPVEPHYHKAMAIAEDMVARLRAELA